MSQCKFDICWVGRCKGEATHGEFCEKHAETRCCVCHQQAVTECDHTGQFVCGAPLCANCEGHTDTSQPPGSWGFMNHSHRCKEPKP